MARLGLNPRYRYIAAEPDARLLLDGEDYYVLEGKVVSGIIDRLAAGAVTVDVLQRDLETLLLASPEVIRKTIDDLLEDGFTVEVSEVLAAERVLATSLGVSPSMVADALRSKPVQILSFSGPVPDLSAALTGAGLRELSESGVSVAGLTSSDMDGVLDAPAGLRVVVSTDYLDPGLAHVNRATLKRGLPWLLINPDGLRPTLGPLFVPGRTGCWECLASRMSANRRAAHIPGEIVCRERTLYGPATSLLFAQTALALANWIVRGDEAILDGMVTFEGARAVPIEHPFQRLVECVHCGRGQPESHPIAPRLESGKKTHIRDGGHRALSPRDAFDRHARLIDPLTGVLRNLHRMKLFETAGGAEDPIHTYRIEHSLVAVPESLDTLEFNENAGSCGKGKTEDQARASALFEGLERYSGVWQGNEYRVAGLLEKVEGAIHPDRLLGYSEKQYDTREQWNAANESPSLEVPHRFDATRLIDWSPVWSLSHERWRHIPTAYGYFGYPDIEQAFCYGDSNGNAAGVTLEEAIVQGFFELVERDATAIWFYNRLNVRGVDLLSFDDPYFEEIVSYYRSELARDLWVLDVTSDLGIPSFVGVSRRTDRHPEDLIMGFGCHLDPHVALSRAVTEVNQILHMVIRQKPDGSTEYVSRDPDLPRWLREATLQAHPYLAPDIARPLRSRSEFEVLHTDDQLGDLRVCIERAASVGLEVCSLDLTRPDIGVPVVKTIVPGLVHYWRRLGLERLYEVPVKLGLLDHANAESDLNDWSIVV